MPHAHWLNTALYRLQGFSGIEGFSASEIAASVCMHLQYTEQLQIDPYCSNVDSTIHCICDARQHISQCGGKVLFSK